MRSILRIAMAVTCAAALLAAPPSSEAGIVTIGPLPKDVAKDLQKQFNQIAKKHRKGVNKAVNQFKNSVKDIKRVFAGANGTENGIESTSIQLENFFQAALEGSDDALNDAGAEMLGALRTADGLPDIPLDASADPKSLLGDLARDINTANDKAVAKLRKSAAQVEKGAAKEGTQLACQIRNVPHFLPPQVAGLTLVPPRTEDGVSILFVLSDAARNPDGRIHVFGHTRYTPAQGVPAVGCFEAGGDLDVELTVPQASDGTFLAILLDARLGPKHLAIDMDGDSFGPIFTDGFESGDTSAWTN